MKKIAIILFISLFLMLTGCGPIEPTGNQAAAPKETKPAEKKDSSALKAMPAEIMQAALKTIDGKPFKLDDQKGKVILLNMWAIWCGPCKLEMPDIQKLSEEMKDQIAAVSLTKFDGDNPEAQVKSFLAEKKFTYNQVVSDSKTWEAMVKESGTDAIPINFVISKDGKIVKALVGGKKYEDFKAAIEEGLKY